MHLRLISRQASLLLLDPHFFRQIALQSKHNSIQLQATTATAIAEKTAIAD